MTSEGDAACRRCKKTTGRAKLQKSLAVGAAVAPEISNRKKQCSDMKKGEPEKAAAEINSKKAFAAQTATRHGDWLKERQRNAHAE